MCHKCDLISYNKGEILLNQRTRIPPSKDIFDNDCVRGIIWSLCYTVDPKEGLEAKHFRFLLMKEYATEKQIKNDPQTAYNYRKMTEFFQAHPPSRDFKGVIKDRSQLSHYLNHRLGEGKNGLGLIHKKGRKYFITDKGKVAFTRYIIKKNLDSYPSSEITPYYRGNHAHVFFGITPEDIRSLSEEEKKLIDERRNLIFDKLLEIEIIIRKEKFNGDPCMSFVQCFRRSKKRN